LSWRLPFFSDLSCSLSSSSSTGSRSKKRSREASSEDDELVVDANAEESVKGIVDADCEAEGEEHKWLIPLWTEQGLR
jgi:hypothetical protein